MDTKQLTLQIITIVLLVMLSSISATAQQEVIVCGSEAEIAKARAARLKHAAKLCRQDLAAGSPECYVRVSWKNNVRINPSFAETLSEQLRRYANELEIFDKQLEQNYGVSVSNSTYVSSIPLRCTNVAAPIGGNHVTKCLLKCAVKYQIPLLDCWRDTDIRLMGLCLFNNSIRLKGCRNQCTQSF